MNPAFDWSWHPHPEAWIIAATLAYGYLWMVKRQAKAVPFTPAATKKQKTLFLSGCVVLLVSAEWPIHDLAEGYLYSVHMVQHLLFTLLAAPLLLAGTPAWMMRRLLPGKLLNLTRWLAKPLIALVVANTVLVLTHWPALVNASIGNELLHFSLHVLVMASAVVMWLPVLSPLIEVPKLSRPAQCGYLFLQSLVPTVPASFLTFGDAPLYSAYAMFPHPFGIDTLSDQRTAGLIMKIVGGAVLWGVISIIWFAWMAWETREGADAFEHAATDRELDRLEI